MNLFDEMPEIPPCPKCAHDGEGLQWAFPAPWSESYGDGAQCCCLNCSFHAELAADYATAVENFKSGIPDENAA